MRNLLRYRPFACILAFLLGTAGCTSSSDSQTADRATVVRLTESEYVEEHAGSGVLIDVRRPDEFAAGHLTDALNINVLADDFRARVEALDEDATYYLYCRSGNRSGQAAKIMAGMGFKTLYNVGGFDALARAGAKTTTGDCGPADVC